MSQFINLHNHTYFSILKALPSPKELINRAKELGQSAIAITDHYSFAGIWDAYKASKEANIKLIVGAEFYFLPNADNKEDRVRHLILLAKNAIGYRNLLSLNRLGFDNPIIVGRKVLPIIDWTSLSKYADGVICLTSCGNGILGYHINNKNFDAAEDDAKRLVEIFGKDDLGIEVQSNALNRQATPYINGVNQVFTNYHLIKLAEKLGLRVVPTSNTHYLKKEDHEIHNVLLAIGAMQPVYSNARLKYNVPDFYLKTYEEVKGFFARSFGETFAEEICSNTVYFADRCESPEWVDLKFSNKGGKELPVFPVKDEADYHEFQDWLEKQSSDIKSLAEDSAYLRFKCYQIFNDKFKHKIPSIKQQEYIDRIEKELVVLDKQGFSSYMLIVADYVGWAKKNGVSVGPGRGCLSGKTLVLTENGFKYLQELVVGEKVYTHTGKLQKVLNTFEFDISNEELIELYSHYGKNSLVMTKDHKVFAATKKKVKKSTYNKKYKRLFSWYNDGEFNDPQWISASELTKKHYIYTTFPQRLEKKVEKYFDLSIFNKKQMYHIYDNHIEQIFLHRRNKELSSREISRKLGINYTFVSRTKLDDTPNNNTLYTKLCDYLKDEFNICIEQWRKISDKDIRKIIRYLPLDNDFMYLLGRWVGDGSFHGKNKEIGISIIFNANDLKGINRIKKYLEKLGFYVCQENRKYNDTVLTVSNNIIYNLFRYLFPDYKDYADTKHFPIFFRNLDNDKLSSLVDGLSDADGHITKNLKYISIKTTSPRLAQEIKESWLYLGIFSTISCEKEPNRYGVPTLPSYRVSKNIDGKKQYYNNGYFSKIYKINSLSLNKVYDIQVEDDHSYLTTNGVVHNSVGGSYLAYLLGIHAADPIRYGLIFERFQNINKVSSPDIDQDFSTSGREKIINYIQQKYGQDRTAFISNFAHITPKVYARDVARSLEFGNDRKIAVQIGNQIADAISKDVKNSLEFSDLKTSPLFMEYVKRYPQLSKHSNILGKVRGTATHAAGIILSNRKLVGLVPVRKDKDGQQALEYEKNNAEDNGLLKVDILGLSTLDLVDKTLELINKNRETKFRLEDIDFEDYDKKTYDLISRGDNFGVFQLGTSGGTIELCKRIKPKSIEDLAIITTLARPSSALIREDFIRAREGKKQIKLAHPSLNNALEKTFGYGLYDESIIQLGKDVAGWSLNSSDRIRKMIKEKGKNPEKDKKLREEFIEGASNNNVGSAMGAKIWDEYISSASGYTFNKSHAVLYSFISYITAYLKANFPIEFLLANLMSDNSSNAPDAEGNIAKAKMELRSHKVKILPPNINTSEMEYNFIDRNTLLTGLDALKFVGDDAIQEILEKRPFYSFDDFMLRCEPGNVRATAIQALAASGCLDSFGLPRKLIYLYSSDYRKKLQVWLKRHDPKTEKFEFPFPKEEEEWSKSELFAMEKHYLGEAFICSKKEAFGDFFKDKEHANLTAVKASKNKTRFSSLKAEIKSVFEMKVKKEGSKLLGQEMAKLTIEDENGIQCSLTIFPDQWKVIKAQMRKNKKVSFTPDHAIHFGGTSNLYDDEIGIIMDQLYSIAPPPNLPKDLKARKISLKEEEPLSQNTEVASLEQELEDELFSSGLVDLTEEDPFSLDI